MDSAGTFIDKVWRSVGFGCFIRWSPDYLKAEKILSKRMLACRAYREGFKAGYAASQTAVDKIKDGENLN